MISHEAIQKFSEMIAQEYHPERIILFGSYAYGLPNQDSDVDLLIILPHHQKSARISAEILCRTRPPFPVDLLVRTPEQIRQRIDSNDFFLQEILAKGKVLYAASSRTANSLEERVTTLEAEVAKLKQQLLEQNPYKNIPWWERRFGVCKDDPMYEEATRLGAEYRKSQPTPSDGEGSA